MQCMQCGVELKKPENFCPLCGQKLNSYQGMRYVSKEKIDKAFQNNEFDFLWGLFDTKQGAYAEYRYEKLILEKAGKITTPSDFELFINKVKKKYETGSGYAKYLYGSALKRVFQSRGVLEGLAVFMDNPERCLQGINLIREAAQDGQTSAEWKVGTWMMRGNENVRKNEREAYRYISRAAQKGHPMAMLKLGEIYSQGMSGIQCDYEKAERWFKAAIYFECKSEKALIKEKTYGIQTKDVEEIVGFYGLEKSDVEDDNKIFSMQFDFSVILDDK